jgi:hypothetical protein
MIIYSKVLRSEELKGHDVPPTKAPSPLKAVKASMMKVALTACMRKLLTILNAMLKHRTPWRQVETQHA